MKDVLVFSWDTGAKTGTSPCSSDGSLQPVWLHALLFFQEIQLIWGSLKHLQVELSQLTSFPHFVNFFLSLDPSTFNSLHDQRNLMFFRNTLCGFFYGLKKTESLHSSKPPEGPGCYCMGDLYYSGSETSQPQISTFFEEMQLSSERKKNSLLLKDKVISSVLRANFSSQISMTDCISGWEQLRHMGNGMGNCFPCSASVTLQGWC